MTSHFESWLRQLSVLLLVVNAVIFVLGVLGTMFVWAWASEFGSDASVWWAPIIGVICPIPAIVCCVLLIRGHALWSRVVTRLLLVGAFLPWLVAVPAALLNVVADEGSRVQPVHSSRAKDS